jgi:hypothetical protein
VNSAIARSTLQTHRAEEVHAVLLESKNAVIYGEAGFTASASSRRIYPSHSLASAVQSRSRSS